MLLLYRVMTWEVNILYTLRMVNIYILCSKINPQNINMNKKQKHNLHFINQDTYNPEPQYIKREKSWKNEYNHSVKKQANIFF